MPHSRRRFLRDAARGGLGALALASPGLAAEPAHAAHARTKLSADAALALLKSGNRAFVADKPAQVPVGSARRLELARGQTPFAVLLGCSDSRVPPELLFERGLGELFTIRVAGNTVDDVVQGSIEYAVAELGVPLVVVMGHQRCGAVGAALAVVGDNAIFPGSIGRMVEPIVPAVLQSRGQSGDPFANAVRENVRRVVRHLRAETDEPVLAAGLHAKQLRVVGAYYDLDTGAVDFFDEG